MLDRSGTSYDIAFEPVATGELIVHVNGVAVPLTVVNEPGPPKPSAKAARARHGTGRCRGRRAADDCGADARPDRQSAGQT